MQPSRAPPSQQPDNLRHRVHLLGITRHRVQQEMIGAHCDQVAQFLAHLFRRADAAMAGILRNGRLDLLEFLPDLGTTGVMLAVARAAGETAPLLFTAAFSDYWLTANPMEPTPSLAVLIYDFSGSPYPNQLEIAWAASLVLVFVVLVLNVGGQVLTRRYLHK